MSAATHDILIEQGATFLLNLVWKDSLGAPINLTGYTARMQVRHKITDASPLLTFTTENGGIALGGALGTITLNATATQTAALTADQYVYDLELVTGATVTRLVQGSFTVTPEVTR